MFSILFTMVFQPPVAVFSVRCPSYLDDELKPSHKKNGVWGYTIQRLIWIFCIKQVHHRIWKLCKRQRLCLKWIAINTLVKTSVASQSYRNSHAWNDLYIPKYEPSLALFGL